MDKNKQEENKQEEMPKEKPTLDGRLNNLLIQRQNLRATLLKVEGNIELLSELINEQKT